MILIVLCKQKKTICTYLLTKQQCNDLKLVEKVDSIAVFVLLYLSLTQSETRTERTPIARQAGLSRKRKILFLYLIKFVFNFLDCLGKGFILENQDDTCM